MTATRSAELDPAVTPPLPPVPDIPPLLMTSYARLSALGGGIMGVVLRPPTLDPAPTAATAPDATTSPGAGDALMVEAANPPLTPPSLFSGDKVSVSSLARMDRGSESRRLTAVAIMEWDMYAMWGAPETTIVDGDPLVDGS